MVRIYCMKFSINKNVILKEEKKERVRLHQVSRFTVLLGNRFPAIKIPVRINQSDTENGKIYRTNNLIFVHIHIL